MTFTIETQIPKNTDVVFVADLFVEDYRGGAELTTEALISSAPGLRVFKLHSVSLTPEIVEKNKHLTWVLCNWSMSPKEGLIALVTEGCKYVCVEYDYKYCKHRSSHLHELQTKSPCDCHLTKNFPVGLYKRAQSVFFMSEGQKEEYELRFPHMKTWTNTQVLSSVWKPEDLDFILSLKKAPEVRTKKGTWAVLSGGSWIKNQKNTEDYCTSKSMPYELLGGLEYRTFLEHLSQYEGLVFHPLGFDTCPRLVVEASLLGLRLDLNENVQHRLEKWFKDVAASVTMEYLRSRPSAFWNSTLQKI